MNHFQQKRNIINILIIIMMDCKQLIFWIWSLLKHFQISKMYQIKTFVTAAMPGKIVYNLIPKTACRTTNHLISLLAKQNHFHFLFTSFMSMDTKAGKEKYFMDRLRKEQTPAFYSWAFHYVNFTRYGTVAMINMYNYAIYKDRFLLKDLCWSL